MSYPSDWLHVTLHISPDYQEIQFDGNKDLGNQIVDAWKARAVSDATKAEMLAGLRAKVEERLEQARGSKNCMAANDPDDYGRVDAYTDVLRLLHEEAKRDE